MLDKSFLNELDFYTIGQIREALAYRLFDDWVNNFDGDNFELDYAMASETAMELIYKDVKYTEDMLITALKTRDDFDGLNQVLSKRVRNQDDELATIRGEVFDFFNDAFTPGDDELTFSIEQINTLLESISCNKLKSLFMVRATIDVTISGVEAEDSEAAEAEVQDQLTADWGSADGRIEEYTIDIRKVDAE